MKKQSHNKVVYKPYVMGQPMLLPPDLEEMIPENHIVRTVNEAIEQLDLTVLYQQYKGGGTSSYHPKMMLKILVYGYIERQYSSRKIAKALRENLNFMWLSGQNRPNFRTINRFREASRIVDIGHQAVLEAIRDGDYRGMTETEIAGLAAYAMRKAGSEWEWSFTGGNEIASGYRTGLAAGACTPGCVSPVPLAVRRSRQRPPHPNSGPAPA